MSKRVLFAALLAGITAACAQQQQPDVGVVSPGPVSVEPVYQGKL